MSLNGKLRRGQPAAAAAAERSEPADASQRRESVRVGAATELHIGRKGFPMVRCMIVDYSGSGLRAVLPRLSLHEGEEVDVSMRLPDGAVIVAEAVVVRRDPDGVSFQFVALDGYQRELLIRQVFVEQRRDLAEARTRQ